jgi:pyruvate dehydrogenase E2 component (dihydrolipoamide acetyltransferase)
MPVKMVQKITAARLTESKQTIPHYYLTVDVKMDNLMKVSSGLVSSCEWGLASGGGEGRRSSNSGPAITNTPSLQSVLTRGRGGLWQTRAMLNKGLEKSGGKLSVTDLIIKASALALMKVPEVNASWMGDSVRRFHAADISIAVQVSSLARRAERGFEVLCDTCDTQRAATQRSRNAFLSYERSTAECCETRWLGGSV